MEANRRPKLPWRSPSGQGLRNKLSDFLHITSPGRTLIQCLLTEQSVTARTTPPHTTTFTSHSDKTKATTQLPFWTYRLMTTGTTPLSHSKDRGGFGSPLRRRGFRRGDEHIEARFGRNIGRVIYRPNGIAPIVFLCELVEFRFESVPSLSVGPNHTVLAPGFGRVLVAGEADSD